MRRAPVVLIGFTCFFLFVGKEFGGAFAAQLEAKKLLPSSLAIPKSLSENPFLKVLLARDVQEIEIATSFPFVIESGTLLVSGSSAPSLKISSSARGIKIREQVFTAPIVRINTKGGDFSFGRKSYRDNLVLVKTADGKMNVMNEVRLEGYLKGVLPVEVSDKWPLEALKAQAVASRTFALFKLVERTDEHFTVTSDVLSQVYAGKSIEKAATNQAVDATQGEVLLSQDRLFPAFFHAACAGQTTRADFAWRIEPNPVLTGVACFYCRGSKYDNWRADVPLAKIESKIAARGYTISPIKNIVLADYDPSGRARRAILEHQKGRLELDANDFRLFAGPDLIRSTRAFVEVNKGEAHFVGTGWGHGVGMCQWGAKGQAESGFTYQQILAYYYPGSVLKRLYGSGLFSAILTNPAPPASGDDKTLMDKAEQLLNDWFG